MRSQRPPNCNKYCFYLVFSPGTTYTPTGSTPTRSPSCGNDQCRAHPNKKRLMWHQIRDSCPLLRNRSSHWIIIISQLRLSQSSILSFYPSYGALQAPQPQMERVAKQEGCPSLTSPETGWLWYSPSTQQTPLRLKAFYSPWPFSTHLSWEKSSLLLPASRWQAIPSKTKGQVVQWHKANMGDLSAFERVTL